MNNLIDTETLDFAAIARGDGKVFEQLFKKYYAALCDYAYSFVDDREMAEDVVQDVFVYFWNRREELEIKISVKAYLYTSVKHGALNVLKKQLIERRHHPLLTEFVEYLGTTDYHDDETEDMRKVKQVLDKLPAQCRTVFLKSCVDGKKYQEIADEMEISINTVKTHIVKAYRLIRQEVGQKVVSILLFCYHKIFF